MKKLFKVYSDAPSYISLLGLFRPLHVNIDQGCIVYWVCWKDRPGAYHSQFVVHYKRLSEDDRIDAKRYIDEKFTEEEASAVKEVLENKYQVAVYLEEISLPIHDEWRRDGTHNLLHYNYPGLDLDKDVPFEVHGYVIPNNNQQE